MGDAEPIALDAPVGAASAVALKEQVPVLGLRDYWYPGIPSRKVKSKPVPLKLLGEEIILFRDSRDGKVYGLEDRCPHKGVPLSCAQVYFPGTLSCLYHGFTFDGRGECVAVLSEGPESKLPGKVRAKTYPVEERWGLVWVFVGDMEPPPPLDQDVPSEHFSGKTFTLTIMTWKHNWRDGMENTADASHAPILHRNAWIFLFRLMPIYWDGVGVTETCNGKGIGLYPKAVGPYETTYPGLGKYSNKRAWKIKRRRQQYRPDPESKSVYVRSEVRVPCWRINNLYPNWFILGTVPIDASRSRIFAFTFRKVSGLKALWFRATYYLWRRWISVGQFIGQDKWVLERMKPVPEKLYKHDVGVIKWRQLAARAAKGRI